MMTGTCYFVSLIKAEEYYKVYGFSKQDVKRKLQEGEIKVGLPPLKQGENLVVIDGGTRYAIQVDE